MEIVLFKVAKELGVGIATIVQALSEVGVLIENKPTTKIGIEYYHYLKVKFKGKIIEVKKVEQKEPITSLGLLHEYRMEKGIPNSVFKYFRTFENDFSTLEEKYLYYSKYNDFNDPFDCSINLIEFAYKKIHNTTKKNDFQESLSKIGICCFSRSVNSILMWSHYSENHKGFCIEFNVGLSMDGINPLDVLYKNEFTTANYKTDGIDAVNHIIYSKAKDWKYEDELRAIKTDLTDVKSRKIPFNVEDVRAIYLGVKCSDKDKKRIFEIVKTVYENKIDVFEGNIASKSFEIEWKKCN
jgi:hypothetical protein